MVENLTLFNLMTIRKTQIMKQKPLLQETLKLKEVQITQNFECKDNN